MLTAVAYNAAPVSHIGFSADCLETLEEIAEENKENFLNAGGQAYRYIPALNANADHITALAKLIEAKI